MHPLKSYSNTEVNEAEVLRVGCGFIGLFKDADIKKSKGSRLWLTRRVLLLLLCEEQRGTSILRGGDLFHMD